MIEFNKKIYFFGFYIIYDHRKSIETRSFRIKLLTFL